MAKLDKSRHCFAAMAAILGLGACSDGAVDVTANSGFHPPVPNDVVRALQTASYELVILVNINGAARETLRNVRVDPDGKTIEPIQLTLESGSYDLQLMYGAGKAAGCTGDWVKLAETQPKRITVEANKSTPVTFPESELARLFDDDADTFSNIAEVTANSSPCQANSTPPLVSTSSTTTTTSSSTSSTTSTTTTFISPTSTTSTTTTAIVPTTTTSSTTTAIAPTTTASTTSNTPTTSTTSTSVTTTTPPVATTTTAPNPVLTGLELFSARLVGQDFQPAQSTYTAEVTFPVDQIYMIATAVTGATIKINDIPVTSGKLSPPIALPQFGAGNPTAVRVDVSANGQTAQYVIQVSRNEAVFRQEAYVKASNTEGAPPGTDPTVEDEFINAGMGSGDAFGAAVNLTRDGRLLLVGARHEDSAATVINGDQNNNDAPGAGAAFAFQRTNTNSWTQSAYLKASNAQSRTGGLNPDTTPRDRPDTFGINTIAASADGGIVAVGATGEDSGVIGDQADNSALDAGAVYVYFNDSSGWRQSAYVKASTPGAEDYFGGEIVLNRAGNVMVVGAVAEDSNATGINGDQNDNSMTNAGAVYAFARVAPDTWEQTAYIKASNTNSRTRFGDCLALSDDGTMLAVGSPLEASNAKGVGGDQANRDATGAGAVYIYTAQGGAWAQQVYIKASNTAANDEFGCGLAFNADATLLAVGAPLEDSAATGVNNDENSDAAPDSGAVYLFGRDGGAWSQRAYIKASNTRGADKFGQVVRLNTDGTRLLVTAPNSDGAAPGVNPAQDDVAVPDVGAAYLFQHDGAVWRQQAFIKPSNGDAVDHFGWKADMSADGAVIAIGSALEDSSAIGVDSDQTKDDAVNSGAVYVFR